MKKTGLVIFFFAIVHSSLASDTTKVVLKLSFIGDIMQHGPQIKSAYNPVDDDYDYLPCFRTIAPSIRQADIAIANLELTLAGKPYSGYPTFSAPDELAAAMKLNGIDVLVTANNHSLDRRKKGLERTIRVLDSLKIPFTGTFTNAADRVSRYPLIIEKKGVKIALLSYTYGTNGIPVTEPNIVNLIDTAQIKKDIEKAKTKKADLIVVFTHWGWEYKPLPNSQQKFIAEFCKYQGADLVIGSHPHVLQPIEKEDNFAVVYSLGNFVSNQRDRYKDGGMIFSAVVEFDKMMNEKTIKEVGYELTWVYKKRSEYGNQYFILPAVQHQFTDFIQSKSDKDALNQFITDSRTHLQKNNKGQVKEYKLNISPQPRYDFFGNLTYDNSSVNKTIRQPTLNTRNDEKKKVASERNVEVFRIQFLVSGNIYPPSHFDKFYFPQVFTEKLDGMTRYLTGDFTTQEEAEDHLLMILNETKYKDAFVVKRESN